MLTHEQAVALLQRVMDAGYTGWLRAAGALGWWVWWEEPGLLIQRVEDFDRWLPLVRQNVDPLGEVVYG